MRTRKNYLDILRIVAIMMVFHFHFIAVLEGQGFLYSFVNGDWGSVGTSLFFLISGNCLARNYGQELDVKSFYRKRWLSIFPAFYLCYILVLFGYTVLLNNHVLAGVAPWRMIFTVLGVDNYMNLLDINNGALVGEWYTAIILLIYLLFPILQILYRKSKLIGSVLVGGLYFLNLYFTWGPVPDEAHPLTGIALFWLGMMLYHFEEKLEHMHPLAFAGVLAVSFCLLLAPFPGIQLFWENLFALCIFMIFMRMEVLFAGRQLPGAIVFFSKIEYEIYLCHHTVQIVLKYIYTRIFGEINLVAYYIAGLVVTLVFSVILMYLSQWIVGLVQKKKISM